MASVLRLPTTSFWGWILITAASAIGSGCAAGSLPTRPTPVAAVTPQIVSLPPPPASGLSATVLGLTRVVDQLTTLKNTCATIPPPEYRARGNAVVQSGVDLLIQDGKLHDAQRLAEGNPPPGIRKLVSPDCEPFTENGDTAAGLQTRIYILNGIIAGLAG